jgi:hypothetical protein
MSNFLNNSDFFKIEILFNLVKNFDDYIRTIRTNLILPTTVNIGSRYKILSKSVEWNLQVRVLN